MEEEQENREFLPWVDRRVPIMHIAALLVQTFIMVGWLSGWKADIEAKASDLDRRITIAEKFDTEMEVNYRNSIEKSSRLEAKLDDMISDVHDIKLILGRARVYMKREDAQ